MSVWRRIAGNVLWVRHIGTFLLAMVLLAAACSDDGAGEPSAAPQVVPTPTAPTTTDIPAGTDPTVPATAPAASAPLPTATSTKLPLDGLVLVAEVVAEGFAQPVFVTSAPGDRRLFVVDQPGQIWIVDGDEVIEFLDIRDDVIFQGERGLLGLAFHPGYATNRRLFLNYTDNGSDTRIVEFTADPNAADPGSERLLLDLDQPASNHNGGMIAFGPDGFLWIGMGDGGGSGDTFGNGQRADTLLGAMLRIDVDGGSPYATPGDNPFADGQAGAPEVWAIGLRNPWRWSFDGDRLYVADVGQDLIEEIDAVSVRDAGLNYGWPIMEGDRCFSSSNCQSDGLVLPVLTYGHGDGCSITGGYVYRGETMPELRGHYFYSDFCSGWVRSIRLGADGAVEDAREWFPAGELGMVTSFGIDSLGELYATTANGKLWRFVSG